MKVQNFDSWPVSIQVLVFLIAVFFSLLLGKYLSHLSDHVWRLWLSGIMLGLSYGSANMLATNDRQYYIIVVPVAIGLIALGSVQSFLDAILFTFFVTGGLMVMIGIKRFVKKLSQER